MNKWNKWGHNTIFNEYFLLLTLFLTGAAVLVLEILGTRVLSPYFGVSLYIWSALITVTLMALALGYWWGGRLADRNPTMQKLYFLILLAGIFILLVPLFSHRLLNPLSFMGIRTGVFLSALILFGPPLFLLGMVTPYAVKLYTPELGVLGSRVGCLYAVSTVGSCCGALLAGFVLIPHMGVSRAFYLLSLVLFLLWAARLIIDKGYRAGISILPLSAALILFLSASAGFSTVKSGKTRQGITLLYESSSLYGRIEVIDKGNMRWLTIDGAPNSAIDKRSGFSLYPYIYYLEMMNYIHPEARNALLVGLGGGCLAKRFIDYGLKVDAVEIDPKVVRAAKDYFKFDPGQVTLHIAGGRRYIRTCRKKYDFIVLDVANGDLPPFHLFSRRAFEEISQVLSEKGVLGINYLGFWEGKDSRAARSVYLTLKEVFPNVKTYLRKSGKEFGNIVFLASNRPLKLRRPLETCPVPEIRQVLTGMQDHEAPTPLLPGEESGVVLTDDYNPIQVWSLKASMQWRKSTWAFLRK